MTVCEPNQAAAASAELSAEDGHTPRPRARPAQRLVLKRVRILGSSFVSYCADEQVLAAWREDRASQKRYAQAPPWCAENAGARFLSKLWYPVGVASTSGHHVRSWVMRRPGRFVVVAGLMLLLWAVWPAPVPFWVPAIAIAWLI